MSSLFTKCIEIFLWWSSSMSLTWHLTDVQRMSMENWERERKKLLFFVCHSKCENVERTHVFGQTLLHLLFLFVFSQGYWRWSSTKKKLINTECDELIRCENAGIDILDKQKWQKQTCSFRSTRVDSVKIDRSITSILFVFIFISGEKPFRRMLRIIRVLRTAYCLVLQLDTVHMSTKCDWWTKVSAHTVFGSMECLKQVRPHAKRIMCRKTLRIFSSNSFSLTPISFGVQIETGCLHHYIFFTRNPYKKYEFSSIFHFFFFPSLPRNIKGSKVPHTILFSFFPSRG